MSQEHRDLFAQRRRRQQIFWYVAPMLFLGWLVLDKPELTSLQSTLLTLALCTLILGGVGFTVWNWRCPSCDGYLGGNINLKACEKCGVTLRE
jgi:hypothetical protein